MITTHEEFIVDSDGKRRAVILPWEEWQQVLEALEEIEDIRAYDEAKRRARRRTETRPTDRPLPSDPIPFDQAVREIREAEQA